jgi:hypothetical protein
MGTYASEEAPEVILPPFEADPQSKGVYLDFHRLMSLARPNLTHRKILLLWTICRGLTHETDWIATLYQDGGGYSIQHIRENMISLLYDFGLHPGIDYEGRTRRQLIDDKLPALVRSVWGIYDLAWGHPITSRFQDEGQTQGELREASA